MRPEREQAVVGQRSETGYRYQICALKSGGSFARLADSYTPR